MDIASVVGCDRAFLAPAVDTTPAQIDKGSESYSSVCAVQQRSHQQGDAATDDRDAWLLLPLPRIVELAATSVADVVNFSSVCYRFFERTWERNHEPGAARRLLSAGLTLKPHSDVTIFHKIQPGALRRLSLHDAAVAFLLGVAQGPTLSGASSGSRRPSEGFLSAATGLECLCLQMKDLRLQCCWMEMLSQLALVMGCEQSQLDQPSADEVRETSAPSEEVHSAQVCKLRRPVAPVPLKELELRGGEFPEAGGPYLGAIVSRFATTIRCLSVDFADTSARKQRNSSSFPPTGLPAAQRRNPRAIDDASLWQALVNVSRLDKLHIAGLLTSSRTCQGLADVLRAHASSLSSLGIGGRTVSAVLLPASALEASGANSNGATGHAVAPATGAAANATSLAAMLPPFAPRQVQPALGHRVSPELEELIAAGEPLRLRRLVLKDIQPPAGLPSILGGHGPFGGCAANLAELLAAAARLASGLEELDLSGNAAVAMQKFDMEGSASSRVAPSFAELGGREAEHDGHAALLEIVEACGPQLTSLDVTGCNLRLFELAGSLRCFGPSLNRLRIAGCDATIPHAVRRSVLGEAALTVFATAFISCEQVQELDLGELSANDKLRRVIFALLQRCAPNLRKLSGTMTSQLAGGGLSSMFSTGTCRDGGAKILEDVELTIFGGWFGTTVSRLFEVMNACAEAGKLHSLQICGEGPGDVVLGDGAAAALAHAIRAAPLRNLKMRACGLGCNGVRQISASIAAGAWRLGRLDLSRNRLGSPLTQLITALLDAPASRQLQELHLRDCLLLADAGSALGRLLSLCPSLGLLDISCNAIFGEVGVRSFLEAAIREFCQRSGKGLHGEATRIAAYLPGTVDLRGCIVERRFQTWANAAVPSRPSRLGRFVLLWFDE